MSAARDAVVSRRPITAARIANGIAARLRVLAQSALYVFSRAVYGNFAGFWNNFKPRRDLARYRSHAKPQPGGSPTCRASAKLLSETGYVVLPNRYPDELLGVIKATYNALIEDESGSVSSPNGATRFLYRPVARIPQLARLISPDIVQTVESYYGCAFKVRSVRAWRNYHVPVADVEEDVYSNTFHNDGTPVTGLRLFVLLCDGVRRDTGAFRFHDKPASRRLARSVGFFHRALMTKSVRRQLADASTLRFFEGNTGDSCLCNTQECLHAASIPKKGAYRDVVQFEIEPTDVAVNDIAAALERLPPDTEIEKMRRRHE